MTTQVKNCECEHVFDNHYEASQNTENLTGCSEIDCNCNKFRQKGITMEHKIKSWPVHFKPVRDGAKTAELRKNDRSYKVGDILTLEEWDPDTKQYTGNVQRTLVRHLLKDDEVDGLERGYVMMSIEKLRL